MSSKTITELNDQTFAQTIQTDGTVLVDFWAEWCQPCHMLTPTLESIASDFADDQDVSVAKLNIDHNREIATKYSISSIPTVLVFQDGELRDRIVGVNTKDVYAKAIHSN